MSQDKIYKYSEELKRHIVKEIESGKMSISDARDEYSVSKSNLKYWLNDYGAYKPKRSIVEVVMKDEKEKIAELEKALSDSHLKNRFYEKLIEIADKEYNTDLKKSIGTKLSEDSEKKEKK